MRRKGLLRLLAVVPVVAIASLIAVIALFFGTMSTTSLEDTSLAGCEISIAGLGPATSLDAEQLGNAETIIEVGLAMGVPERGLIIAIATAMQESTLRNLTWGDRDSVGLFQQRPSSGWGTVAELTHPPTASRKFYEALLEVPGWQQLELTVAAQAVQRSAFPNAYAKWEPLATQLVRSGGEAAVQAGRTTPGSPQASPGVSPSPSGSGAPSPGGGPSPGVSRSPSPSPGAGSPSPGAGGGSAVPAGQLLACTGALGVELPDGAIGDMLAIALEQQGKPYVWGATGPDSFDCSGLIVYSWAQAGYQLRVRTADQMYQSSAPVAAGTERPGDLLFSQFGVARVPSGGPGHVKIVVAPGLAVEAPRTGLTVRLVSYDPQAPGQRFGRLTSAVLQPIPRVA